MGVARGELVGAQLSDLQKEWLVLCREVESLLLNKEFNSVEKTAGYLGE